MAKTIQYKVDINTSRAEEELQDLNNQLDDIQEKSKVDLLIDSSQSVKSVGDVRKAYKALRDAQIEVGEGTEEFTRLGVAAAGLKDKLDAVNEVAKDLGGSTLERFRNSLGRIKEGIVNLDLDKVRQGFGQLRTTFTGLTTGISTARLAVIGFTTALAASGIGLIVIVLSTLLSQFEDLSKAGGLVGKVFTGLNNIVDGFKNTVLELADAWGLVDKNQSKAAISARDAAKEQAKLAAEKLKEEDEEFVKNLKNKKLIDTELITDSRQLFIAELNNKKLEKLTEFGAKLLEKNRNNLISEEEIARQITEYDKILTKEALDAVKKFDQDVAKERQKAREDAFNARLEQIKLEGEIDQEDLAEREAFTQQFFDKEGQLFKDAEDAKKALRDKTKADVIQATNDLISEAERKIEAEKKLEEELTKFKEQQEEAKRQAIQATFNGALSLTSAVSGLVSQLYANEIADAEGNFERQEELREESFEANKALQIASTVITTAQAVMNGLNAGLQIGGPWGIALGAITAAAAAATGAIQLATIEATRYQPSGGSTPSITAPSPTTPASVTPNVTFAGGTAGFNQVGQGSQSMNINASISVNEINSVQNQVAVYETGSLLG